MLTRKQHELLLFIHERLKETGIPPSFDEMKEALDLSSKSGIHRLITALEERGFIRRLPNRARALEVVRLPDSIAPGLPPRTGSFAPSVIDGGRKRAAPPSSQTNPEEAGRAVPVMGRIAAGSPIDAIRHQTDMIVVPRDMLAGGGYFALEVRGDTLIEAEILEGDSVEIDSSNPTNPVASVVAQCDDSEA